MREFQERLNRTLTDELSAVHGKYDYILLNYGLLQRFVDEARSDADALVVPPGCRIRLNPSAGRLFAERGRAPGG